MSEAPTWIHEVIPTLEADLPEWFTRFAPPTTPERSSAVLMLLGHRPGTEPTDEVVEVVLTERSASLRSHASQVSFPGGRLDPGEDAVTAAIREAHEEVGLDPASVEVVGTMPPLYLTPSRNSVTPVLAWWSEPHPLHVASPVEVASIERVAVADLAEPANRFTVRVSDEYEGIGFDVHGLYVWGFTAHLIDVLLTAGRQRRDWDLEVVRPLPWKHLRPIIERRGRGG